MVKIEFPDGSTKEFDNPTGLDIANSISEGLGRAALAVKINDDLLQDLTTTITESCKVSIITFKDKEGKELFWHSSAHILATAIKQLFPEAKLAIGPAIENGFYYDVEVSKPFHPEDLEKIEAKFKEIVKEDLEFKRKNISYEEAVELFKDNKFKLELIEENKENLSIYETGNFVDLCRGPHIPSTKKVKAVKITKMSSAYWRGDSERESLQRVYGITFPDKKDLTEYLTLLEEAEKRNHVKIGKQLDLVSFHEEAPGVPFWHPKGTILYNELQGLARRENTKRGYNEIMTPMILNSSLWKLSGHWDNFKENMYFTNIDGQEFAVKPMNCPGGLLIYKSSIHSYRDLPLRNAEFGFVHRHELSGVLNGLFRVRAFTQDDAHSFCTEEQIESEIIDMVEYAVKIYEIFGFKDVTTFIATKPEKAIGSDEVWNTATQALINALNKKEMPYRIKAGEGAFYGPKIEFNIKDALGRNWQCGTIQVDFSMPTRFDATYEAKDGTKKHPVMIHRAILGSLERFIGIVIEHYAGKFPLWLNPNQVKILPIADRHQEYANKILKEFIDEEIRADVDDKSETIPKKVRNAQLEQFNYILVVGDKELEDGTVTVRTRAGEVEGTVKVKDFKERILKEIREKL
ncbi:threonine--tRNA ligase [Candidatus Woesearchaeota archaeon]|nr:threonine--tRNA ligase [Candidatus Woesearchaeota archaeon]